jgi:hypothetical protein
MTDTTINGDIYVISDPEGHFVMKDLNDQDTNRCSYGVSATA